MAESINTGSVESKITRGPERIETPSIKSYYDSLKKGEASPADQNEPILIGKITPEDPEYQQLILSGSTPQQIESRRIKRGKILQAGFIFNNHPLPEIEKPLINMTIDGVNYGQRKLLTKEEMEKIKQYQRQHPDVYGTDQIADDEFREEMLSFLLTGKNTLPRHVNNKVSFLRICAKSIASPAYNPQLKTDKLSMKTHSLYQKLVDEYLKYLMDPKDFYGSEVKFINEHLGNVMPWEWESKQTSISIFSNMTARGKNMSSFESRETKLNGLPSPFLDSGFHFLGNPDYQVIGSNEKFFRVNMLVLHLASRGISEMGDGKVDNGEQDYSIGNYIRDLAPKTPEDKKRLKDQEERKFQIGMNFNQDDIINSVQVELKKLALDWGIQTTSPRNARKLARNINKINLI